MRCGGHFRGVARAANDVRRRRVGKRVRVQDCDGDGLVERGFIRSGDGDAVSGRVAVTRHDRGGNAARPRYGGDALLAGGRNTAIHE